MMRNSDTIVEAMTRSDFEPKWTAEKMPDGGFALAFEFLPGEASLSVKTFATAAEALEVLEWLNA